MFETWSRNPYEDYKISADLTELKNKLNNEKFDADLVKLLELWSKLWKEIVVKDIKKEEQKFSDESEETPQEPKKKKRKWFRNK